MSEDLKQEAPVPQKKRDIDVDDGGLVAAKTLDEQYRYATMLCAGGMLPKSYDSPEKVLTGMTYARELGLKPLTALKCIAIVQGTPTLFGDLPLAIARSSGQLESFSEFLIDDKYERICFENKNLHAKVFAAVCMLKRKGYESDSDSFTEAEAAKHPNRGNSVWTNYRSAMMTYKARSKVLKRNFADYLGGAALGGYMDDSAPLETQELIPEKFDQTTKRSSLNDIPASFQITDIPSTHLTEFDLPM